MLTSFLRTRMNVMEFVYKQLLHLRQWDDHDTNAKLSTRVFVEDVV